MSEYDPYGSIEAEWISEEEAAARPDARPPLRISERDHVTLENEVTTGAALFASESLSEIPLDPREHLLPVLAGDALRAADGGYRIAQSLQARWGDEAFLRSKFYLTWQAEWEHASAEQVPDPKDPGKRK